MRLNIIYYIVLLFLIILCIYLLNNKKKDYTKYLIIILLIHYFIPYISNSTYLKMIDVGQGDSILLHSNNETILIDTGGVVSNKKEAWKITNRSNSIINNITIPILKSLGIKKIDYLILTHGDYDHLGEAINIIKKMKVETIIINCNKINYLENNIMKLRPDTILGYEGLEFNAGDLYFYQMNTNLIDENDSSQIYYVNYKDTSILLTGDASIKSEKYILDNYNLQHINILKVGHHGSKTSTSDELLRKINPDIALISAGVDNKFNHPNKETIDKLDKFKIDYYLTAKDGTITINLDKLLITTKGT